MKLDRSSGNGSFPNPKLLFAALACSVVIGGIALFSGNDADAAPPQQEIKADTSGHAEQPATFDH